MAFAVANAHVVVDVAHTHSGVGSHGPALVNTHGGYGGWGYGGDAHHGYSVGYPHGAPHITLHTTGNLGKKVDWRRYSWKLTINLILGGYGGGYGGYDGGAGAGAGAGAGHGHHGHDGQYVASSMCQKEANSPSLTHKFWTFS